MRYLWMVLLVFTFVACGGDKLASVNGRTVTKEEFDSYLKDKHIQSTDEKRRAALLDQYLQGLALAAAVEKSGLVDQKLIAAQVKQYRDELLISSYFDQVLKDKIDEEAVRAYYEKHQADYTEKQIHVAHILFRTHALMTEEQRKTKREAAQKAYEQVKGGKPFADIAKQSSEDKTSAQNNGDMGWIKEGGLDKRFADAAFKLEVGAVSEPVESAFGFHIITVLEGPRTITQPLTTVAANIRNTLKTEAQKAETEKLLSSIKVMIR